MRFVVYGAGAVGGVVGAQLHRAGHDVTLVARGDHYRAIRDRGLVFASPVERLTLEMPVVADIAAAGIEPDVVVLMAVKSQSTLQCSLDLRRVAPVATPVVCLQNGVENEPTVMRFFSNVYGVPVMCPAVHLEPGVVEANSAPVTGILDIGRFPVGTDETAIAVAAAFSSATFVSEVRPDIMAWKHRKLMMNIGNAVQAICGPGAVDGRILEMATAEAGLVLAAAGVAIIPVDEDRQRRGHLVRVAPVAGRRRPGGSSWQSLERHAGSIETDYLNGYIVLLGRLHNVPTPVNALLQRLADEMAVAGAAPATIAEDDFLAMLEEG